MSRRKKTNTNGPLVALLLFGAVVVGALAYYVTTTTPTENNNVVRPTAHKQDRQPPLRRVESKTYFLYNPDKGWAAEPVQVANGENPQLATVRAFLASMHGLDPKARLLSAEVRDGKAELNFTREFGDYASAMGSFEESGLLNGILRTLGQFEDIKTVDLKVEGESFESGHQVYDDLEVIRPGAPPPSQKP